MRDLSNTSRLLTLLLAAVLPAAAPSTSFEDASARSGLDVVLRRAATTARHQIETTLGGLAALDYDGDGLLDLYFTNGAAQPGLLKSDPTYWNRLYRNRGNGVFEDVTVKAGVRAEGYSMGAAAADYDNNGRPDLFVAGVRRNILYRNRGDGAFEDVTARSGIHGENWSVGAGWFDYDNDGHLDLFVVNYVEWDPATEQVCKDPKSGQTAHCHPKFYNPLPNTLYHNNGDGTFTDVSEPSGIRAHPGKGMSVAFADYDADGLIDAMVANDALPNSLFHNDGKGHFTEVAMTAGIALNDDGRAVSSMGVDFRDVDNDGRPDLFITALVNETFPLYRNLGKGLFADFTYRSRVGAATMAYTGWGSGIYDFNNDGRKDLFCANGDLNENAEALSGRPARQPTFVLVQQPNGTFERILTGVPARYRGAAFGDFDNDGRIDAVVARIDEKPLFLRNTGAAGNHWLGIKLEGQNANRDGMGAWIKLTTSAGAQWNQVTTSVGYASSSDVRVHFGLGPATRATAEVHWPGGKLQHLGEIEADRYHTVKQP